MAEYIDRERVIQEIKDMDNCGCITRSVNHVCENMRGIPTADVIERSEYENVLRENKQLKHIISDKVDKDLKCAFEVKELRSKIDKALEQTYKVRDMVLHSNRMYEPNDVLEIIDEITACFERSIGE